MLNLVSVAKRSILLLQLAAGATGRGLTSLDFALSIALLDDTTSAGYFFPFAFENQMLDAYNTRAAAHFSLQHGNAVE